MLTIKQGFRSEHRLRLVSVEWSQFVLSQRSPDLAIAIQERSPLRVGEGLHDSPRLRLRSRLDRPDHVAGEQDRPLFDCCDHRSFVSLDSLCPLCLCGLKVARG